MINQLTVTDEQKQHLVVLSLPQDQVNRPAADVVFDVLGAAPEQLVAAGILAEGQVEDLKILQGAIFDQDAQGSFIRETISFRAGLQDLDPDGPMSRALQQSEREGVKYMRGDLTVLGTGPLPPSPAVPITAPINTAKQAAPGSSTSDQVRDLSRVMFIHQIARGYAIDVTNELPELSPVIAWAEANELIEIDVQKVAYKLTAKGKRMHDFILKKLRI